MLNEFIDIVGMETIEKGLSNVKLRKTLLCIIKDKDIEISVIDDDSIQDLEKLEYVKERLFYTEYMSNNKAIVIGNDYSTPKLAITANKYALAFNSKTVFINQADEKKSIYKKSLSEILTIIIKDYMSAIKKYTECTKQEEQKMLMYSNQIAKEIEQAKNIDLVVRILIDKSVEDYKSEFEKYFFTKIFDAEINKTEGRLGSFITLNGKKPLLPSIGTKSTEIQIYNIEDAYRLYKTKFYMDRNFGMNNRFRCDEEQTDTIKIIYDPKDKAILGYEQNPYLIDRDEFPMSLQIKKIIAQTEDYEIKSYSQLVGIINKYCKFSLGKESKNDTNKKLIYHRFKDIIKDQFIQNEEQRYIIDKFLFKTRINDLMRAIINFNKIDKLNNKDGLFRMREILNFKIQVEDYFDGGKRLMQLDEIKIIFKNVITSKEEVGLFEQREVAMFAAGQLAFYLNTKNKGKNTAKLIAHYHNLKTYDRLGIYLKKDMKKYDYDISMYGREFKVYSAILANLVEIKEYRINKKDMYWFEIGLFGENLFFTKNKENLK